MAERRQGPRRGDRGWGVIRSPRYWNSKRGLPVPDSGISKPRHPAKLSNPQEPRTHGAVEETSEETSARHEILQNRPHRRGVYRLSISTGHRHEEKSTAAELGSRGVPERCVSINVARQTTFAQLAEKLTVLADIHGQLVQPVHISIATALSGTSVYQSSCSAGD